MYYVVYSYYGIQHIVSLHTFDNPLSTANYILRQKTHQRILSSSYSVTHWLQRQQVAHFCISYSSTVLVSSVCECVSVFTVCLEVCVEEGLELANIVQDSAPTP